MPSDRFDNTTTETREVLPDKQKSWGAGAADLEPAGAIMEAIDNIIDNSNRAPVVNTPKVEIIHDIEGDTEVLKIHDDSGGVPSKERMDDFLQYGVSTEDTGIETKIGSYSVGIKKATKRLANHVEVISQYADPGHSVYALQATEDWFEDSFNYEYELHEYNEDPAVDPGETRIIFKDLEFIWDNEKQNIEEELTRVYELFLRDDDQSAQYGNIEIEIIDKTKPKHSDEYRTVLSVDDDSYDYYPINWSYIPKAFYPRRYENIPISAECDSTFSGPIHADITVGFVRETSDTDFGTHMYVQGRNIFRYESDTQGGFGTNFSNTLSALKSKQRNLLIVVELRASKDAADLPWDSVKSRIDTRSEIMGAVYNWMYRIADDYLKHGGDFRIPLFRPYDGDNKHSYTADDGGRVQTYDYTGNSHNMHKPDTSEVNDIEELVSKVETHLDLGVKCEHNVPASLRPAYWEYLETDADPDELTEISADADSKLEAKNNPKTHIDTLVRKAKRANQNETPPKVHKPYKIPNWGKPYYKTQLLAELGLPYSQCDHVDELPDPNSQQSTAQPDTTNTPTSTSTLARGSSSQSTLPPQAGTDDDTNPTTDISLNTEVINAFQSAFECEDAYSESEAVETFLAAATRHSECSHSHINLPDLESPDARRVWAFLETHGRFGIQLKNRGPSLDTCDEDRTQAECVEAAIEALFDEGYLTYPDLPITTGRKRYILNTEAVDREGDPMEDPHELRDGVWLETKNNSREKYLNLLKVAEYVAEHNTVDEDIAR